jgi:hypothetical protein
MYENKDGEIRECDGSGEDPTCGDQWTHSEYNCDDHHYYLQQLIDYCIYDTPESFLQ